MVRTLLIGDALRVFNNRATTQGAETVANLVLVLNALGTHMFPVRAMVKQKRHMRRFTHKPAKMPSRDFMACILEMNQDLNFFPPYAADQALDDDEMLEIAEFGLRMKWQKAMVEHDFDCSQKTIDQIIDFAERQKTIEALEQGLYDGDNHPAKKTKKAPEQAAPYKNKGGLPGRAKSSYEARRQASSNSGRKQNRPVVCTGQAMRRKTVKY